MANNREAALAEFKRAMAWITGLAVLLVIGVLTFLGMTGELHTHMVVATIAGVFVSAVVGCGLFALAFFSDKSGHDQEAADATQRDK